MDIEELNRDEAQRRQKWEAKWAKRCRIDRRIEAAATVLCVARGINPNGLYRLPMRYRDVLNPPDALVWLIDQPNWMQFRQEAFEFLSMKDAVACMAQPLETVGYGKDG